ncbi:hypothetical protein AMATHDRAFT_2519 [Amanita thiersii Skay4041]|uniref:Uncharacterized protein n=1 Tax=Amanita thiersii Skay4041 TaxID=703135 RepID=A0A2A9NWE3_9AGAR|nr:hypothetical protein AMATHDRAFT_2519 [Amanita thiersii Skay4041]
MRNKQFVRFLAANYANVKNKYPRDGRRLWQLRVLQEFWTSPPLDVASAEVPADNFMQDVDPLDIYTDGPELGVLLRTDFSDDDAWDAFCSKLQMGEQEIKESISDTQNAEEKGDESMDEDDKSGSEETSEASRIIGIINPSSSKLRALLNQTSNLTALRLLNDVDVRPSPTLPDGKHRIKPEHRLVDYAGWQEIYKGVTVWIYDAQSNRDQCARLVSQRTNQYGAATGDSWRARVTHICELQVNMSCSGLEINFGGLDRWDRSERMRNLQQATWIHNGDWHSAGDE